MWLVEFLTPWCGYCQRLAPHLENVASQLRGKVKVGTLNMDDNPVISDKYQVRGMILSLLTNTR